MKNKKRIALTAVAAALISSCAAAFDGSSSDSKTDSGESRFCGRIEIAVETSSGGRKMNAVLFDNSSSRALLERLENGALTLEMEDYGGFEKVASLGFSLPRNDTPTRTAPGDLILYQGHNLCIYYGTNSWNFTPLGKIENVPEAELKSILGNGSVRVTISAVPAK